MASKQINYFFLSPLSTMHTYEVLIRYNQQYKFIPLYAPKLYTLDLTPPEFMCYYTFTSVCPVIGVEWGLYDIHRHRHNRSHLLSRFRYMAKGNFFLECIIHQYPEYQCIAQSDLRFRKQIIDLCEKYLNELHS